ncbi:MAG: hypothetical protein ACI9P8_000981, partial [Bacteroidia bacterium]
LFNTNYTPTFGTDSIAAVASAKALPDFQARNESTETAYIQMGISTDNLNQKWRMLRSYIKASYPTELQKPKLEAAGEGHYNKSVSRNWGETELMCTSALTFITDNTAELTTGGMPAAFPTDFDAEHTTFATHYTTFTDSEQDEHEGTDGKIIANNNIYDALQRMFEDGQVIFENDASKRERFIFARVKELITNSSNGKTDSIPSDTIELKGTVTDFGTNLPIEGATISVTGPSSPNPVTALSNADGDYTLASSGYQPNSINNIDVAFTATGYTDSIVAVSATSGQSTSLNTTLKESA